MAALGEGDRCRLADSTGAQFGAVATEVRPSGDPTERLARLLTDGIPLPAATSMGRAGAEVARRLAARLDAEGCRSDDENGMGFKMDVDAYIGFRPRCFDVVDHRRPYDPDAIIRHCRIAEGVTVAAARRRMEEIWMDLRYPSFEEHAFEDADDGFAFHFLTMVPPDLGVTGWIECRVE